AVVVVLGDDVAGRRRGAADRHVPRVEGQVDAVAFVPDRGGAVGAEADGVALDEGFGRRGDAGRGVVEQDAVAAVAGDDVAGRRPADGVPRGLEEDAAAVGQGRVAGDVYADVV